MKLPFYPGCSLKAQGKNFETSGVAAARALGVELIEIERWNCCGTVYSLTGDDLMRQVAPVRNLIRVQEIGGKRMVTLCAMCYNTEKRAGLRVRRDKEDLEKMNAFMDEEEDYRGEVDVVHLLEILRDEIGFERIRDRVEKPLRGLRVSPYYGCMLLRPREAEIDDGDRPRVMEDLLRALGAEVIDHPYKSHCCGSYHTVDDPQLVAGRAQAILSSITEHGGEMVALSCPLCKYNLDDRQELVAQIYPDFSKIPVVYFTQLMALAFGLEDAMGFDNHYVDPRPLLEEKGFLQKIQV
ncbi:MAG: CoB--CoM heterodisulfide reductase iron-sulfur subunit B family protein [Anaerolineales bacterium]